MKTTKSSVLNHFTCISVGYCDLQNLLNWKRRAAHTEGVYGWNADVYTFDDRQNVAIVTGYRPFGESVDSELIRKYEKKARKVAVDETDRVYLYVPELSGSSAYDYESKAFHKIMFGKEYGARYNANGHYTTVQATKEEILSELRTMYSEVSYIFE